MNSIFMVVGSLIGVIAIAVSAFYFLGKNFNRLNAEFGPTVKVDQADRGKRAAKTLAEAKDEYERWVALGDVALWQAEPATAEQAKAVATELLALTDNYRSDWNYGNAIHKANSGLGRLALRQGDMAAARGYLLASARSKGSPQMNTFGPNMLFAGEMAAAGEKQAVIEYFDLCATFWKMEDGRLAVWKRDVAEGRAPNFGANILY
ncbi:MAG: hypothetical protein JNN20_19050 [Betaproteobacteria bacterium]|nr:hypothetical protein [Betaproteobacteria bacterium]